MTATVVAAKQRLVVLIAAEDSSLDVFYGRADGAGSLSDGPWVSVGAASATFEVAAFRGDASGVQWLQDWTIDILVGSGVAHGDPAEADTVAYTLLRRVLSAVAASPRLGGLSPVVRVRPSSVTTHSEWIDGDTRQTVLRATVDIQIRDSLD